MPLHCSSYRKIVSPLQPWTQAPNIKGKISVAPNSKSCPVPSSHKPCKKICIEQSEDTKQGIQKQARMENLPELTTAWPCFLSLTSTVSLLSSHPGFSEHLLQNPGAGRDVPQGLLFPATLTSQISPHRQNRQSIFFGKSKKSRGGSGSTWTVEWCDTDSINLSDCWWNFVSGPEFGLFYQ